MKTIFCRVLCTLMLGTSLFGQDMSGYNGGWQGQVAEPKAFSFSVHIEGLSTTNPTMAIYNGKTVLTVPVIPTEEGTLTATLGEDISFEGRLTENKREIHGFFHSGILLYHTTLKGRPSKGFIGKWNILMLEALKSPNLFLSVENGSGDTYQAYPVFGDDRFTGTWCADFQKSGDSIHFRDFKTGLRFKGKLSLDTLTLGIFLGSAPIAQTTMVKNDDDWYVGGFTEIQRGVSPQKIDLDRMEQDIQGGQLPNIHAVLVAQKDRTLYETYFAGYTAHVPHDMRSASKSIASTVVGLAMDRSLLPNVESPLFDFLPTRYQGYREGQKSKIDIQSLLTMSSGLDAIDFGIDQPSMAAEDKYQRSPDWTTTILEAPMLYGPNTHANYGSANPYLLGVAMDSVLNGTTALFMDRQLFQKLGITDYIIQTDLEGRPYFGGGMYMTPADMLKFGQLYLNQGKWRNEPIVSKNWIDKSLKQYGVLENTKDKNGYGYLWWHHTYQVDGTTLSTWEARGAGGQYIFVIPDLETVVVITSGNFNNGKTQLPETVLEHYILPQLLD